MSGTAPSCMQGEYGIALLKQGTRLGTAGAKLQRIEYSRVLDAVSTATVDLITAGQDCCGQLGAVDHWNTDLVITAKNPETGKDDVVWRGVVKKPTFRKGSVTIEAVDVLGWLQVRALEADITYPAQDVSDIFVGIWTAATAVDPPHASLLVYKSGVVETRVVDGGSSRMAWSVVGEMLDAGLDVTTFGSRVIVGAPAFDTVRLTDKDVIGNVEVYKDGDAYVNRAIANASRDIKGVWPPGPKRGNNGYPLVEAVVGDSQLADQASADAAAKAHYDFAVNGVRRVRADGGLVLLPNAPLNPRTVIAGQPITFAATETCYAAEETLRLGKITVVVEKGIETATIDLQPMGGAGDDLVAA